MKGAIQPEISTPEDIVTAAGDFSVFVIVRNPFDVPIQLLAVETHLPPALVDSVWIRQQDLLKQRSYQDELEKVEGSRWLIVVLQHWCSRAARYVRTAESPRIAAAISPEQEALILPSGSSNGQTVLEDVHADTIFIRPGPTTSYRLSNVTTKSGIHIGSPSTEEPAIISQGDTGAPGVGDALTELPQNTTVVLAPGDSVVRHFVLRARRRLFFSPISYTFRIQISYSIADVAHFDTAAYALNVRAAQTSTIAGAIVGGVLGSIARSLGGGGGTLSAGAVSLSAILGAVAVVALARKANAQQIVSVEDIWGGLLVGFLVGYLGESYFRQFIK